MRVAALYDVHGNLSALEAVLADSRCAETDAIVCGGDLVAGPMPAACLDLLLSLGDRVRFLRGNGDREVVAGDGPAGAWCAARLGEKRLDAVRAWPSLQELHVTGLGAVQFCHATPRSDEEIVTQLTPAAELEEPFERSPGIVVVGHTHVQFDRRVGDRRIVNAGSVGAPYEERAGAYWLLLGPRVELVHSEYDTEAALADLVATGYPAAAEWLGPALRCEIAPGEAARLFEERRGA